MTSNAGKRLAKIDKLLDTIATRSKQHHFIVVAEGANAVDMIADLHASGSLKEGDDMQVIAVPWRVNALHGHQHIPEGNDSDPLADPRETGRESHREGGGGFAVPGPAVDLPPSAARLEAWRSHEAAIERAGQRYQGDKSTKAWR